MNGNIFPEPTGLRERALTLVLSLRLDVSLQVRLCLADESGGQMVKGLGSEGGHVRVGSLETSESV